jgi:hypothetical protein
MLVDKELNQQYLPESGFVVIYFEAKNKALFDRNIFCPVNI